MMKRLLTSALCAGFAAGLFAALLQLVFVEPTLLTAELYETGALVHPAPVTGDAADPAMAGHSGMAMGGTADAAQETAPAADATAPAADAAAGLATETATETGSGTTAPVLSAGAGRLGMTVLFMALVYAGYGALLVAAMALAETRGQPTPSLRQGVIWGLAGFVALQLAPAFGLAPGLPGMAAADVGPRQVWWIMTALCTIGGLGLFALGRGAVAVVAGAALIALPQIIGAPQPEAYYGSVPPELAARFTARVLGAGMASWAVLGLLCAWFLRTAPAR